MRELKDSGIKWAGACPTLWKIEKFKYHFKRRTVKNPGNVPVLSLYREFGVIPKDSRNDNHNVTSEDTSKYLFVRRGDFVINKMKAWQGSVAVSAYEGIVSPAYYVYEFEGQAIHRKYFHYFMRNKSLATEFRRLSGGIREGQWDLAAASLENCLIYIPTLQEQQAIASFLDEKCAEIDALVEDIQAEISTLEELKTSIITEAVTKGLNPNVEMKNSGIEWIGKCPKHWNILKIRDSISSIESGVSVNAANYPARENEIGVLKTSCVSKYIFDASENKAVNKNEENRVSCPVKKGCIVVSRMNTPDLVGACGYVSEELKGIYLPDRLWQVHVKSPYSAQYITYYLMSHIARSYYASIAVGTSSTMQNISQKEFGCMFFCVPEIAEQQAIADYLGAKCDEIEATIAEKKEQLSTLTEYKTSLIYEYVTGKKEVPQK